MKSDSEIAKNTTVLPIADIAAKLGAAEALIPYGVDKGKLDLTKLASQAVDKPRAKLVLVTAINPTPAGEGKTTVTIGLADALSQLGKKTVIALREPSLGPVFGIKGGAAGGGLAQVVPMEAINLHFTGDFHAITAANNLLAALVDNHIYHGNELAIDSDNVVWRRVLDVNDRQLRTITSGQSGKAVARRDGFDITAASEVMAVFCLAADLADLERRLGAMLVAYAKDGKPIFARDLKAQAALTALLKDAFNPNLVQSLEGTPALVHGGPFANIAHGCNSLIATKTALQLGDFVVTEAGFGADLGAEKFCDIKCRLGGIAPDVCVVVATVRALKYNGGVAKDALNAPNLDALKVGLENLRHHIITLKTVFNLPVVVAVNRFASDSETELQAVVEAANALDAAASVIDVFGQGGKGGLALAQTVVDLANVSDNNAADNETDGLQFAYPLDVPLVDKITQLAQKVYGADGVKFTDDARADIAKLGALTDNLPVCIAKTQYSLTDDAKQLARPTGFCLTVKRVQIAHGAGFVIALCGSIMRMPALPKTPALMNVKIQDGEILGLF